MVGALIISASFLNKRLTSSELTEKLQDTIAENIQFTITASTLYNIYNVAKSGSSINGFFEAVFSAVPAINSNVPKPINWNGSYNLRFQTFGYTEGNPFNMEEGTSVSIGCGICRGTTTAPSIDIAYIALYYDGEKTYLGGITTLSTTDTKVSCCINYNFQ